MWAYVADYIRVNVLYNNGGIYFDTDVSVVKRLDCFLNNHCFVGIQCSGEYNYTEPAILGSEKGNEFIKDIVDFYQEGIWNEEIYTMPQIFEKFIKIRYKIDRYPPKSEQVIINLKELTIYPERYFIPFEFGQNFSPECVEEDTYTIHWFGGSWCKPEIDFWLRHKHLPQIPKYKKEKKYYILSIIPFCVRNDDDIKEISVFSFVSIFKIKIDPNMIKVSFLGIPIIKIIRFL